MNYGARGRPPITLEAKAKERRIMVNALNDLSPAQLADCARRGMLREPQKYLEELKDCVRATNRIRAIDAALDKLSEAQAEKRSRRLAYQRKNLVWRSAEWWSEFPAGL